jgi:hypothetical protein
VSGAEKAAVHRKLQALGLDRGKRQNDVLIHSLTLLERSSGRRMSGQAFGQSEPLIGAAAFGDWRADLPGLSRIIRPDDLPKPGVTPSVANFPKIIGRAANSMPQAPTGFKVELFAHGLSGPRELRVAPNGDIFVAEPNAGRVRVLRAVVEAPSPQQTGFLPAD